MEKMKMDLTVRSLQDYFIRFSQILELAGDKAKPSDKATRRAFVGGLQPEVVRKRIKQQEPETYKEAFALAEKEVREIERMTQALGVYV